jgi:hypothetical protein
MGSMEEEKSEYSKCTNGLDGLVLKKELSYATTVKI